MKTKSQMDERDVTEYQLIENYGLELGCQQYGGVGEKF